MFCYKCYNLCLLFTMEVKKKRSANFSSEEISILMKYILEEINIIENKKTDGATLRDKQNAWKNIQQKFNSCAKDHQRDIITLKMKYDNIKKNLKKKLNEAKRFCSGTGGGPMVETKLLWYEEQLYGLLQLGIEGLPSIGDSDHRGATQSPPDHDYFLEGNL